MLTRLEVTDVRPGMFVHRPCGPWTSHALWRRSFLVDGPDTLERLRGSGVTAVWIDLGRSDPAAFDRSGADPRSGEPASAATTDGGGAHPPPGRIGPVPRAAPESDAALAERSGRAMRRATASLAMAFRDAQVEGRVDRSAISDTAEMLQDTVERDPGAMLALLRLRRKDEYTSMHSVAVGAWMLQLARRMGLDEGTQRLAAEAGLLHDIGKVAVPLSVLRKAGRPTEDEWAAIRRHPRAGHELLTRDGRIAREVADACLHHHERVDGTGYPDRLAGDAIPLLARMTAVCDVFDAITSDRPYSRGISPGAAVRRMAATRGGHFDEIVFRAFVATVGTYPVGTLVRLRSHRLAVVVRQHPESPCTPTVRAFYSIPLQDRIDPRTVELRNGRDAIEAVEEPEAWGLPPLDDLLA